MTRRRTELYVVISLLLFGCFCVRGADFVRERNWTMRTPWGPVGIYELSYSQPTLSGGSMSADRFGHTDFCFGPLGRFSRKYETPRMDADWRHCRLRLVWSRLSHGHTDEDSRMETPEQNAPTNRRERSPFPPFGIVMPTLVPPALSGCIL